MIKIFIFIMLFCSTVYAAPPVILFSDFTDAPITGFNGSGSQGAAVTIWGYNFGGTQGSSTVTACGQTLSSGATNYAEWGVQTNPTTANTQQRITFYLNSSMSTGAGTITVTTSGGTSNAVSFYCRTLGANHIYFVDAGANGDDTYTGLLDHHTSGTTGPWKTTGHVRNSLTAGDVAYFRTGTNYITQDTYNGNTGNGVLFDFWYSATRSQGSANNSINISSYPAEVAQFGDDGATSIDGWNQYDPNSTGALSSPLDTIYYWTISRILWKMHDCAVCSGSGVSPGNVRNDHNRWIGNEMRSSTNTSISGSVFRVLGGAGVDGNGSGTTNLVLYGNYLHDAGGTSLLQVYNLYFGAAGYFTHTYVGWNEISNSHGGRGEQTYCHSTSDHIEDFEFHDNFVHNNAYTGAIFGGGDGNAGVGTSAGIQYNCTGNMYVWNNIFSHNGWDEYRTNTQTYPNFFVCIMNYPAGFAHCAYGVGTPSTTKYFWNNTLYDGGIGNFEMEQDQTTNFGTIVVQNDISIQASGNSGHYLFDGAGGQSCSVTCVNWGNNLYFGTNGGNEPSPFPDASGHGSLFSTDPKLTTYPNPSTFTDFVLLSNSPAINAGTNTPSPLTTYVTQDIIGCSRPQGAAYDMGAYEYAAACATINTPAPSIYDYFIIGRTWKGSHFWEFN